MDASDRSYFADHNLSFSKDLFATTFFVLTGFHGMHVTGGVIYNICVLAAVNRGRYGAKHVEIAGIVLALRRSRVDLDFYFRLSCVAAAFRGATMTSTAHSTANYLTDFLDSSGADYRRGRIVYLHCRKFSS